MQKNWFGKKMKRTFITDAIRNIFKNTASYISIILISLLGAASFLSMDYTSEALRHAGSDEYNKMSFRDLEITSPLLLTKEDVNRICETEGVKDAEMVYFAAGRVVSGNVRKNIKVISLTERINRAEVTQGRLPAVKNECAVEERLAAAMGWKTGDKIEILSGSGDKNEFLTEDVYIITGYIVHPDHINPKTPEDAYIAVIPSAFHIEDTNRCMTAAELVVEKDGADYRFGQKYRKAVEEVSGRIQSLAKERYALRYDEVRRIMTEQTTEYIDSLVKGGVLEERISEEEFAKKIALALADDAEEIRDYRKEAEEYLDDRERLLSLFGESWFITDVKGSSNFVNLMVDCESLSKLKMTFSLMFLLLGVLVIYATINRIINEQRTEIGTMKAFGFHSGEIFLKYLIFGVSATFIGTVSGMLLARFVFEVYVLSSYDVYYTFNTVRPVVTLIPTLAIFALGTVLSCTSCFFACRKLLHLHAVELIRPQIPQIGIRYHEKEEAFALYYNLMVRNVRMDVKRVIVTVLSVAGCCTLIVTGFTLKENADKCPQRQFSEITAYDVKIKFTGDEDSYRAISRILTDAGAEYVPVYEADVAIRMGRNDIGNLICADTDMFSDYYHLYDIHTKEKPDYGMYGILIPRRSAELYSLRKGDRITITSPEYYTVEIPVAGVIETYIGSPLILNEISYKFVFGSKSIPNTFYVKLKNADMQKIEENLVHIPGYIYTEKSDVSKSAFDNVTSVLNPVIVLFIFLAVMMASVVLGNLTNLYMLRKKKELTIMRINGFTVAETVAYMMRETIFTTFFGVLTGCMTGYFMSYRILRALEQPYIRLVREISVKAWIIGAGLTVFFVVCVNLAVLAKIRKFRLADL